MRLCLTLKRCQLKDLVATLTTSFLLRIETIKICVTNTVCCRCTEEQNITPYLTRALLWCKWSRLPLTHISVSNLLTEQDVKSVCSYCTRVSRGWWWGRGLLTCIVGQLCFLFSSTILSLTNMVVSWVRSKSRDWGQRTWNPCRQKVNWK